MPEIAPFLVTPHLYLRPIHFDDAEMVAGWLNNPEIRTFLRAGRMPLTLLAERAFIEEMSKSKTDLVLVMVEQSGNRPIGVTGLHQIDSIERRATFGIAIGEPSARGRGFGTEALRAIARHAFRWLNLHRIELEVYATNTRAIRSYVKVGFVEEGRMRSRSFIDGKYEDMLIMGLLASDFDKTLP